MMSNIEQLDEICDMWRVYAYSNKLPAMYNTDDHTSQLLKKAGWHLLPGSGRSFYVIVGW